MYFSAFLERRHGTGDPVTVPVVQRGGVSVGTDSSIQVKSTFSVKSIKHWVADDAPNAA